MLEKMAETVRNSGWPMESWDAGKDDFCESSDFERKQEGVGNGLLLCMGHALPGVLSPMHFPA